MPIENTRVRPAPFKGAGTPGKRAHERSPRVAAPAVRGERDEPSDDEEIEHKLMEPASGLRGERDEPDDE